MKIVPGSLAFITGDYALDDLLEKNKSIYGGREFFFAIVIFFLILGGHVVVMNVFTGLAVGDVATIQTTAEEIKWRSLIKFLLNAIETTYYRHSSLPSMKIKILRRRNLFAFMRAGWKKYFGKTKSVLIFSRSDLRLWLGEWEALQDELEPIKNVVHEQINAKFLELETKLDAKIGQLSEQLNQLLELTKQNQGSAITRRRAFQNQTQENVSP